MPQKQIRILLNSNELKYVTRYKLSYLFRVSIETNYKDLGCITKKKDAKLI